MQLFIPAPNLRGDINRRKTWLHLRGDAAINSGLIDIIMSGNSGGSSMRVATHWRAQTRVCDAIKPQDLNPYV